MVGYILRYLGVGFNQASFQRISSTPTTAKAKLVYFVSGPGFFIFSFCGCMVGFVAYAYFHFAQCDPLASGRLKNPNQIVILLVLELFESLPGMTGLFLAALFSASLSTLSSGMGSVSTIFWEDVVRPRIGPISEVKATLIAKFAVLGCGAISIGMALVIAEVGGSLGEISGIILGAVAAPLTGLCLVTLVIPSIHSRGVLIGTLLSSGMSLWLALGKSMSKHLVPSAKLPSAPTNLCNIWNSTLQTENITSIGYVKYETSVTSAMPEYEGLGFKVLYTLSPFFYNPLIIIVTIVLSFLFSLILGRKEEDIVDEKYIIPVIRKLCCHSYLTKYTVKKPSYDNLLAIHPNNDGLIRMRPDGMEMIEIEIPKSINDQQRTHSQEENPENKQD